VAQSTSPDYVVVARRYRPQSFGELVGQQRVAKALGNAIERNRVGHAYLFTGARGVGKTSSARIFAKALNCEKGPTATPCNECDICQSVTAGEDVDVLEIDGASNRGIEEIRQLRANINVRPSRARFKIYIIDEVHMFTKEAFNALLKTLEEPPEHAKFIFCTTDPEKIPITVLSRCQRFDFGGILPDDIVGRLRHIVEQENVSAEEPALKLIARRANGSMRDSQSLLEQILAFGDSEITLQSVHRLLGTADNQQLVELAQLILAGDAASSLKVVHDVIAEGVDPGQLLEELLRLFRDLMVVGSGGSVEMLSSFPPDALETAQRMANQAGLAKILAAVQCIDETLVRLHRSTYGQVLAETAVVRLCRLEDLDSLSALVATLKEDGTALTGPANRTNPPAHSTSAPQKKTNDVADSRETIPIPPPSVRPKERAASPPPELPTEPDPVSQAVPAIDLTASNAQGIWTSTLNELPGIVGDYARKFKQVAISGPNCLVVEFLSSYNSAVEYLRRPASQEELSKALLEQCGQKIRIEFRVTEAPDAPAARTTGTPERNAAEGRIRQRQLAEQEPLVQKAMQLFDAEVTGVRLPDQ